MGDAGHSHDPRGVIDHVDDAMIAYADAIGSYARKLDRARLPRFCTKRRDVVHEPAEQGGREPVEVAIRRVLDLNAIREHGPDVSARA